MKTESIGLPKLGKTSLATVVTKADFCLVKHGDILLIRHGG